MYYIEGGMAVPYTLCNSAGNGVEQNITFAPFGRSTISIYNRFTYETLEKVVTVKKRILESNDSVIDYSDIVEYGVRVADGSNIFTSGLNVSYIIFDSENYKVDSGYILSDDEGYAKFRTHLEAGNYTIKSIYCGVVNYNDLQIKPIYIDNKYKNIFLKSVTAYFGDSGKSLNYGWQGNFKGFLKIFKGNKVIKTINLNSAGYVGDYFYYKSIKKSFKTNNIKSLGTFKAKIVDATGKVLASSTIKILKAPTKIISKNIKTYISKKLTLKINVKNKKTNSKISSGKIRLTFNGKRYNVKVSKGLAKISLKMPSKAKNYKCKINFPANKNYYASSAVFKITVKKIPSEIFGNSIYSKTKTKTNLKSYVFYKNEDKRISGGFVKFTFKGKTYKVKLVKGVANLKIKMPSKAGTYKCKVKYLGSSKFTPSSSAFSVVVQKKLAKGQYMDWCHGGDGDHKAVWTKKYYGKSLVGTVYKNGVPYRKYVKLYKLSCKCDQKKYHKEWMKYHHQKYYTYETITATNYPKYVYQKVKYKTISVAAKWNKYTTKKSGKYKVETYKFKSSYCDELCIWLYKNKKMIKKDYYLSKYYYKYNGKSYSTSWRYGGVDSTYHHYQHNKNMRVTSVKVKVPIN